MRSLVRTLSSISLVLALAPGAALATVEASIVGPVAPALEEINPVLGDLSFYVEFGRAPRAGDGETLRIRTHLAFVEELLASRDVSDWSAERRAARRDVISLLRDYREAGEFPRNYDLDGRRPCFIDRDGTHCAVGYLLAETAGADVAASVNVDYQYASIEQMELPLLDEWLVSVGLTRTEAAMIQPFYSGVSVVSSTPGHLLAVPSGSGPTLSSMGLVVTVRLVDLDGNQPIQGYPPQDLWLGGEGSDPVGLALCQGNQADAPTDANGMTTFSGALAAGGVSESGLRVYAAGVFDDEVIQVVVNSPDNNGDRQVDLVDVGNFVQDFQSGYAFRSDLAGDDQVLNLLDVATMATYLGDTCQ